METIGTRVKQKLLFFDSFRIKCIFQKSSDKKKFDLEHPRNYLLKNWKIEPKFHLLNDFNQLLIEKNVLISHKTLTI